MDFRSITEMCWQASVDDVMSWVRKEEEEEEKEEVKLEEEEGGSKLA